MSDSIILPGYDSQGPDTLGAGYARRHPDDKPEAEGLSPHAAQAEAGVTKHVAGRYNQRFTTGKTVRFLGKVECEVVAVSEQGLVLDTRLATAEEQAKLIQPEQLVMWRGVYWLCMGVRGVFVTLQFWGPQAKRKGVAIHYRKGKAFVRQVPT